MRYSLYQDGEIRYPESIACRGDTVVAYFLTSTIRDYISETIQGFGIERHWNIVPEGIFGLSFCLELPVDSQTTYLFPGVKAGPAAVHSSFRAPGERTCYANGLYLLKSPESVLLFSDPARSIGEAGSIEFQHMLHDDHGEFARVELRVPAAADGQPQKRRRRDSDGGQFFRSDGQFEYKLRLNLVAAPREHIHRRGISAVLERNPPAQHSPSQLPEAPPQAIVEAQVGECARMFLVDRGPLCGLLEMNGANRLTSLAGCTLALIQLRYLGQERDAVELSRRLADFSLKGQHPRGLFFPFYWKNRQSWLPPDSPIAVPLHVSATIALMLLRIASALQSRGLPASAYLHGAFHTADSILGSKQDIKNLSDLLYPDSLLPADSTVGSPVLIELFLELHKLTGRDVYKKAVQNLKSKFFSREPQSPVAASLDETGADLEAILLYSQTAVLLEESGYPVKELHRYFDALLPWIYLNRPGSDPDFNPMGGISGVLGDPTLQFRGFELSYTLLQLDARMKKATRLDVLDLLVSQLLAFTVQKPMGTSCFDPRKRSNDRFGPRNAARWMRELYYLTRLFEEYPEVVRVFRTAPGPATGDDHPDR